MKHLTSRVLISALAAFSGAADDDVMDELRRWLKDSDTDPSTFG